VWPSLILLDDSINSDEDDAMRHFTIMGKAAQAERALIC
jgi:hypothetical protein